jgi:hypothetical protein
MTGVSSGLLGEGFVSWGVGYWGKGERRGRCRRAVGERRGSRELGVSNGGPNAQRRREAGSGRRDEERRASPPTSAFSGATTAAGAGYPSIYT